MGLELVAEGAVGLEGVVAGQTGEGLVAGVVGEAVVRASGEVGFEAADAAEVPGGVEQLVKQVLLEGALGLKVGLEGGLELVGFLALVGSDDQVSGG